MSEETPNSQKFLGIFSLIMITVGSVDSIRNLSTMAMFRESLIFFFIFAAVFFLIPSMLIASELAAAWPEAGGIYTWVKHAFGKKVGFIAIWFQWVENIIWYPTILSFTATTIAYLIAPNLINNKIFLIAIILSAFWSVTIINILGLRISAIFSGICTLLGLLLPVCLIIAITADWILSGYPLQINLNSHTLIPNLSNPAIWVALTGIIMSFAGMEISTIHAHHVKSPHRSFPIALAISTMILLFTLSFGSLSLAAIMPNNQIGIMTGVMQIFATFLVHYKLNWILPLIGILIIVGNIGGVNHWVIAPTKGLAVAAKDCQLPLHFSRENKYRSPHLLLFYQAIIVTLLSIVFLFLPSISASYWLMTALAAQLYMLMYLIFFASAIHLRFKHPTKERPFKIPGKQKHFGMILVGTMGIIGSMLTFFIGFIPPINIQFGGILRYEMFLVLGLLIMSLPPFLIKAKNS